MTPIQIKAMRVKLAAKRTGKSYRKVINGRVVSVKPFTESLHPRGAGGKFTSKPGGGKPKGGLKPGTRKLLKRAVGNKLGERSDGLPSRKQLRELDKDPNRRVDIGGMEVSAHELAGHGRNSRYYRAKDIREARAKRAAKQSKPSRPSATERANRIVKKLDDRSSKMEPATIEKRLNRIGKKLNASEVAAVQKNLQSVNIGKTKAEQLARIRDSIYARRKSRDRGQSIMPSEAKPVAGAGGKPYITWETRADADAWIAEASKRYPSKNHFLASDEYKQAYPHINKLHKAAQAKRKAQKQPNRGYATIVPASDAPAGTKEGYAIRLQDYGKNPWGGKKNPSYAASSAVVSGVANFGGVSVYSSRTDAEAAMSQYAKYSQKHTESRLERAKQLRAKRKAKS